MASPMRSPDVTVAIGDVICGEERSKSAAISFFVRHQSKRFFGFITTGHIFKHGADDRNEPVFLKKYTLSRDKHETCVQIGQVLYHRVGSRRDFALVVLDASKIDVQTVDNSYSLGLNIRQLDIAIWERHALVRTGQAVFLLCDGRRVPGKVIDRNFTGYSKADRKGTGKIVCVFDYPPLSDTSLESAKSGQLLVAQSGESVGSTTYQAVGILWGRVSKDVFLFTSIEFLLDGLAIPERLWHFLPCRRAGDQNPVVGPPANMSAREDDDENASPLFELVHQLRKLSPFSVEDD